MTGSKRLASGLALGVCVSAACAAQEAKKAEVFHGSAIAKQWSELAPVSKDKGSAGTTLGDYGSHVLKLSLRNTNGGAEVHHHFNDVLIVTGGGGTLVTGGEVVDSKEGADGEVTGSSVRGGSSQEIGAGDVVHVPAGVPHQIRLPAGGSFQAIVIKVRE